LGGALVKTIAKLLVYSKQIRFNKVPVDLTTQIRGKDKGMGSVLCGGLLLVTVKGLTSYVGKHNAPISCLGVSSVFKREAVPFVSFDLFWDVPAYEWRERDC
jgi:hypothetical protein